MTRIFERSSALLRLAVAVVGSAIASFSNAYAFNNLRTQAQVISDNTLGSVVTDTGNGIDTISGGSTRSTNLFHSFEQFSVLDGRTAFFNNAANIQNILTRITGGSVSNIDGLIRANGAANLFLLNPNGIVFGQNARLNIGGSFIATTASRIDFADGVQFSATPGTGAPLLTVSVPLGLQFGANPGNIINRASGVGLQVGAGKTLGLIGGNVNLEGGRLTARGGRIELGAVAAPGVVGINPDRSGLGFSFPKDLALGDISLSANTSVSPPRPASVDVRAGGGGSIAVNARNLRISGGSALRAGIDTNLGSPDAVAGDIDINVQDTATISGTGRPSTGGIYNSVQPRATGKGGSINLTTGSLFVSNGAFISAGTLGTGDAGNVNITAGEISIEGLGYANPNTGIFSRAFESGRGNGGNINIKARSLTLTKGAQVNVSTFGTKNAGNIFLQVDERLSLSGSYILSAVAFGAEGNGGTIDIKAGTLSLTKGAQITADVAPPVNRLPGGRGNGGKIKIDVRDAFIASGSDSDGFRSGVFTTVGAGAEGQGGDIEIKARLLSLEGAEINAYTLGKGNAGNIFLRIDDTISLFRSNILSSVEAGAVGNGGTIDIKARSLSLTNGARLNTSSFGQGDAGNVIVDVRTLDLDNSGIFAQSTSGNGGDIRLRASKSVRLRNGSQISTSAGAGQQPGDGGNITIDSPLVIANANGNNDITANAFLGSGGRIEINAQSIIGLTPRNFQELQSLAGTSEPTALVDFLSSLPSNDVAAISLTNPALGGTVSFNAADIDPSRDVVELPEGLVDASALVASGCPSGAENRFTVTGRGGLPPVPGDKLSPDALLTDWATLQTPETGSRAAVETTIPEAAKTTSTGLVEATSWQFDRDGKVMLTTNNTSTSHDFAASPNACGRSPS
jgi:filamentous hemagglutinin family protein